MQRGERVQQRLHLHGVDRPATTDPLPLIVRPADQALFVIGEKRQPMDLFRLELENCQLLPLQRIGKNIIERGAANRYYEWLLSDTREDIFTIDFSECDRRQRMLTRLGLGRVLRRK